MHRTGPLSRRQLLQQLLVGEIPDYALWPQGGLVATKVFYKRIGAAAAAAERDEG